MLTGHSLLNRTSIATLPVAEDTVNDLQKLDAFKASPYSTRIEVRVWVAVQKILWQTFKQTKIKHSSQKRSSMTQY